jgi:hypothetical protein
MQIDFRLLTFIDVFDAALQHGQPPLASYDR